ncbi:MAG: 16S rRNA (cytidine(1402)-2'-O)-methyltransferase [Gammaproteobacteria bacterium]|jgi:16S rRNA (cytidine1402-2'-O)-methyltransferase
MNASNKTTGVLYVVATPIGNLLDITRRALEILQSVSLVAAEDTRHSRKLLAHYGIGTPMLALHEHNERTVTAGLLRRLEAGADIALVSDAGTPLISDPGFHLVRSVCEAGLRVVPVPGPSALTAALSVAGLPTDRFIFEGFLPAKQAARRQRLQELQDATATLVFYESSHRILASLGDMLALFGAGREATLARELTKTFETIRQASLAELHAWVTADSEQQKGEFVILVHGAEKPAVAEIDAVAERVLRLLMAELPLRTAAALTAQISGIGKNVVYERALQLKDRDQSG